MCKFRLTLLALGDILDGQQKHQHMVAGAVELAGIEQHRLWPDAGEVVSHLEVVEVAIPGQNLFQNLPQNRNVPLAIPSS